MNEIRMYVERLFEGRVLTAEMIELKEEIYGNLVARYEDYIAEGMEPVEALEKTKASMTSIDDVLSDDGANTPADAPCSHDAEPMEDFEGAPRVDAPDLGEEPGQATVCIAPALMPKADADAAEGGSRVDEGDSKESGRKALALGALGVFLVLALAVGILGAAGVLDMVGADPDPGDVSTLVSNGKEGPADMSQGNSALAQGGDDAILVGADGSVMYDGEPADDLLISVVNTTSGDIKPYVETALSDAPRVEALVRALPMSKYACDIDTTKGVDALGLAYRELPEAYDGDSVDAALAYNVTALFCALPTVNEIQVTTTEADEPRDESYYVFKRDDAQRRYGVRLDGNMVNEAGWDQIKRDNLYRVKFIDRMVDAAERAWK